MSELLKILFTLSIVCWFSFLVHVGLSLWEVFPIKEERSTPIYISKELYK